MNFVICLGTLTYQTSVSLYRTYHGHHNHISWRYLTRLMIGWITMPVLKVNLSRIWIADLLIAFCLCLLCRDNSIRIQKRWNKSQSQRFQQLFSPNIEFTRKYRGIDGWKRPTREKRVWCWSFGPSQPRQDFTKSEIERFYSFGRLKSVRTVGTSSEKTIQPQTPRNPSVRSEK